jgi:hypothetical protein
VPPGAPSGPAPPLAPLSPSVPLPALAALPCFEGAGSARAACGRDAAADGGALDVGAVVGAAAGVLCGVVVDDVGGADELVVGAVVTDGPDWTAIVFFGPVVAVTTLGAPVVVGPEDVLGLVARADPGVGGRGDLAGDGLGTWTPTTARASPATCWAGAGRASAAARPLVRVRAATATATAGFSRVRRVCRRRPALAHVVGRKGFEHGRLRVVATRDCQEILRGHWLGLAAPAATTEVDDAPAGDGERPASQGGFVALEPGEVASDPEPDV